MVFGIRGLLRGGRAAEAGELVAHTVGNALVLHVADKISPEAQNLALAVTADEENDIVVLDLGADLPTSSWEAIAAVLPRRRRGIRLLATGRHRGKAALVGQWLSERLNRTVVAPDGVLVRGAAGVLFVDSVSGSGWVQFRRGKPPVLVGKRYPAPPWDGAVAEMQPSSATGEIEPLPGGVWIRPTTDLPTIARYRNRLVADIPCTDETMTVLVGCPGTPMLRIDDVIRFWRDLDPETRGRARFVQYGTVQRRPGLSFGQTLADALETTVVCYSGVPVGSPRRYAIKAVRPDGGLGWEPFALELRFTPNRPGIEARRPTVVRHRPPIEASEEIDDRVYWYAPDAVVEVVQAGLWVRSPKLPAGAGTVRAAGVDAETAALFFDDSAAAARTQRMRDLATDLAARLDLGARDFGVVIASSKAAQFGRGRTAEQAVAAGGARPADQAPGRAGGELNEDATAKMRIVPGDGPIQFVAADAADVADAPDREEISALRSATAEHPVVRVVPAPPVSIAMSTDLCVPAPDRVEVSVPDRLAVRSTSAEPPVLTVPRQVIEAGQFAPQPVPDEESSAVIAPELRLDAEREWMRRTLSDAYAELAGPISRIIAEHPSLRGDHTITAEDALVDTTAIRLFLGEHGPIVNAGLRSGVDGPHVPFGRCLLAGTNRLPSFRGATIYRASPAPGEWELYRARPAFKDWGCVTALTAPCRAQDGDTDVVIWSLTGRRTAVVEPDGPHHVQDRVLFAPGTGFKVLELRESVPGRRGAILLREIGANEILDDGEVPPARLSFDELALTSLHRSLDKWATLEPRRRIGEAALDRFAPLPGLSSLD